MAREFNDIKWKTDLSKATLYRVTISAEIIARPLYDRASRCPALRQYEFYKFLHIQCFNRINAGNSQSTGKK
ncbi:hypothetical protein Hanom_Chr05g00386841 [Helianthus anomalus]